MFCGDKESLNRTNYNLQLHNQLAQNRNNFGIIFKTHKPLIKLIYSKNFKERDSKSRIFIPKGHDCIARV